MNRPLSPRTLVKGLSSWAERLEAYKGSPYERQALLTISEEAAADGLNHDRELSLVAYDAATLADEEQRALMVADVERILGDTVDGEDEEDGAWLSPPALTRTARAGRSW